MQVITEIGPQKLHVVSQDSIENTEKSSALLFQGWSQQDLNLIEQLCMERIVAIRISVASLTTSHWTCL
jgi:hypothetical protein